MAMEKNKTDGREELKYRRKKEEEEGCMIAAANWCGGWSDGKEVRMKEEHLLQTKIQN